MHPVLFAFLFGVISSSATDADLRLHLAAFIRQVTEVGRSFPLRSNLVLPAPKWRVEDGTEAAVEEGADIYHAPVIENQESDTLWYSQYFMSKGSPRIQQNIERMIEPETCHPRCRQLFSSATHLSLASLISASPVFRAFELLGRR
jgi:hypothetical protein